LPLAFRLERCHFWQDQNRYCQRQDCRTRCGAPIRSRSGLCSRRASKKPHGKEDHPIAQQEVAWAEEALRLTRKNLETGTGLIIDVLVAQDAADQARLHYVTAVARYNQAEINLLAALGLIDQLSVVASRRRSGRGGAQPPRP